MKKPLILVLLIAFCFSCEDVIDVDLNESEPKLVIEANVLVLEDGSSDATVRLTTSAPFFENQIPIVDDAVVTITSEDGTVFPFTYTTNGIYTSPLNPQPNVNYTLEVVYQNETYSATERLYNTVPIEFVEQEDEGGFTGDDIELKAFFTDPEGRGDYYFVEALSVRGNDFDVTDDEFFDGNQIFIFYIADDLQAGDEVQFVIHGVNEQFHDFMFTLLQQSTDSGAGPFQTQPATVRGNMINQTNFDNFPLGYFRISETFKFDYIVQ